MTRSRKRWIVIVGCVVTAAVLVGIAVLLFGFGQSQSDSAGSGSPQASAEHSQDPSNKKLVADAAARLAVDLTSGNQAAHNAAWSHTNIPPLPPGTTIAVDTNSAQYSEAYSQVNAKVTVPGKSTVKSIIHLEPTGNGWRIHTIEEVK
jgi:hypothetical protein